MFSAKKMGGGRKETDNYYNRGGNYRDNPVKQNRKTVQMPRRKAAMLKCVTRPSLSLPDQKRKQDYTVTGVWNNAGEKNRKTFYKSRRKSGKKARNE